MKRAKKVFARLSILGLSLLWLTPSYICAMDRGQCPLATSLSHSASKDCSGDCCQTKSRNKHSTVPCQTNSTCGIQQNATPSESFVLAPGLKNHFVALLPTDNLVGSILIAVSRNNRPPSRGHPVQDFFSNFSNLSPPSLA
jgi:hypothetical protein